MPLQQHHPHRRRAIGGRGRERHLLRVAHAGVDRLGEPRVELRVRVGREILERPPREGSHSALRYASAVATTRSIEIRTEIPGPRSRELLARAETAIAKPLQVYLPVFAAEARNATITDVDGNTFIDFAGGVGVINVGHCHPQVVEAIQEQAATFVHTDFTVVPYASYVELAERLGELAPIAGPTRAAFFNSGAEAVENAVKIARLATGRPAVIAFEAAFHGRTMLAMTMTSKVHPYKTGMGPFAPEVYRAPFPNAYRGPSAAEALAAARADVRLARRAVPDRRDRLRAAARRGRLRPGAGRVRRGAPRGSAIARGSSSSPTRCRPGSVAPGEMFAMEHFDVEADLIIVAKSIAAGLPLSGVIGKAAIMDAPHAGAIGGTYIGNPVALAAALAVARRLRGGGSRRRGRT